MRESELRETIRTAFARYDEDTSGAIDACELRCLVQDLGGALTDSDVSAALRVLDSDGSGTIELDEFVRWWTHKTTDLDGDGAVSDLEKTLERLKELGRDRFRVNIHTAAWRGFLDVVRRLVQDDGELVHEKDATEYGVRLLSASTDHLLASWSRGSSVSRLLSTSRCVRPRWSHLTEPQHRAPLRRILRPRRHLRASGVGLALVSSVDTRVAPPLTRSPGCVRALDGGDRARSERERCEWIRVYSSVLRRTTVSWSGGESVDSGSCECECRSERERGPNVPSCRLRRSCSFGGLVLRQKGADLRVTDTEVRRSVPFDEGRWACGSVCMCLSSLRLGIRPRAPLISRWNVCVSPPHSLA